MPTSGKSVEKADDYAARLGQAREALAKELVRATDLSDGGMDVVYAGLLVDVLHTLKEL